MNSPFSRLLGTNHAASDDEAREIHQLLARPLEKLDYLNSEITRLETTLSVLKQERDHVEQYIDAHKALLSPARRLPSEILSEIFVHCLPQGRNATRSLTDAPLLLGQICRVWREVSLSTPYLWTSLHIAIPDITRDGKYLGKVMEMRTKGVETWLARSGTMLPLSVSIYASCRMDRNYVGLLPPLLKPLFDCLAAQLYRWKEIEIETPVQYTILFKECLDLAFPGWNHNQLVILNTLSFQGHGSYDGNTSLSCLFSAPNLRRISWNGFIGRMKHTHIISSKLTHLDVCFHDFDLISDQVLGLLSQFSASLQFCRLQCHIEANMLPRAIIHFPFLQTLDLSVSAIRQGDVAAIALFFQHLSTPALHTLKIEMVSGSVSSLGLFFSPLLSPNNRIQNLDICVPSLTLDNLLQCLALLPNLSRLSVKHGISGHDSESLLRALRPSSERPVPLCLHLQHLSLFSVRHHRDRLTQVCLAVLDLVRTRSRRSNEVPVRELACLETISLSQSMIVYHIPGSVLYRIEQELDKFRREGVVIDLGYSKVKDSPFEGQQVEDWSV
ncbi:hypothetical protein VKT23_011848 [Stygiomarasmius scandens]|uniref:F-box domain-containing protein n=1 Tax=Marasmiellus scandens TaxID=2682957 RepID=A0ABR1JCV5_9AGAR